MINAFDDVKFEAASVLAELYEQQTQSNLSKPILRKAIELSQHSVYWHCRLIFQLAVSLPVEKLHLTLINDLMLSCISLLHTHLTVFLFYIFILNIQLAISV